MPYTNIREEELKMKVAQDYFQAFDCTKIIGNIDFCVTTTAPNKKQEATFETESLLWAEAKKGKADIYKSIVQLILTIGKARTFDKNLPPAYLGAFDFEKIAFIAYNDIHDLFYMNDFNWTVTPSNHSTKEFILVLNKVRSIIDSNSLLFDFDNDEKDLKTFIKTNFISGKSDTSKIRIDKSNFMVIYNKWLSAVKPTIAVNWEIAKKSGIIDGDFYLADLLSLDNESIKDKLYVLLRKNHYELDRKISESGLFISSSAQFTDNQIAHNQFWNKYDRPPKEEYWDYIVERRDLLVPQDVRERKGSFFTPQIWVELSQKYLTDVLGEDWQDEYYVWDCAAGTGNLLTGLTNKYNIWASTLDTQDVEVMKDRIKNGANLLEDHVFQFDFLNDEFTKLPPKLQEIINDPKKRKKLVIYINPPYAEAGDTKQRTGTGKNKEGTTIENKIYLKYADLIGKASNELFTQFLIRIFKEIPGCRIGNFSKIKNIQSPNFQVFRSVFKAKLNKLFLVQANTFDNVKGLFPIGFFIWDTKINVIFDEILADVYSRNGVIDGQKLVLNYNGNFKSMVKWLSNLRDNNSNHIGMMNMGRNDFQNQNLVYIKHDIKDIGHSIYLTLNNMKESFIYFSVRHCIEATWLNDRDQFLYPNDGWKNDKEFQNDCLAFTLFHGQNRITSKEGTNHWLPFTEQEVNAREKFDSNFMTNFIKGKVDKGKDFGSLYDSDTEKDFRSLQNFGSLKFSPEATAVFDAGRELWRYYHKQPNCNVNASLYDIREHFQGRNDKGKMNNKSDDAHYMQLIGDLRVQLKLLAKKIEPKVYEYGFLKG